MSTSKIKFVELNYHYHQEISSPGEVIAKHLPSNLFAHYLKDFAKITLVKHLNYEGELEENEIHYQFFRRNNRFTQIPSRTHGFIRDEDPDLVLVQGFIFPIQVIFLRKMLGKKTIILLQHHGEQPGGKKIHFQRIADRYADGYLFSSLGNAEEWIRAKVIKDPKKCFELPSSSTGFSRQDKKESRQKLGIPGGLHFLWVGRLNANKDPLTALNAFDQYCRIHHEAHLWMLFSEDDMLEEIKKRIEQSLGLTEKVHVFGKRPHAELETWFSAADYYISSSHREGGSYALTEAMACGCVPVVTNIPPSMNAIDYGKAGYYFEPGNSDDLFKVLGELDHSKQKDMSELVIKRFNSHMSANAIADKLKAIYLFLQSNRA